MEVHIRQENSFGISFEEWPSADWTISSGLLRLAYYRKKSKMRKRKTFYEMELCPKDQPEMISLYDIENSS
ncbi:hypothetical protein DTO212C5_9226 [Paecilomyces variotii]|nr:hypothetical protein DTO212C5_9226 [Paecilomyces variotii]